MSTLTADNEAFLAEACEKILRSYRLSNRPHPLNPLSVRTPACERPLEQPVRGSELVAFDMRCKPCVLHLVASFQGRYLDCFHVADYVVTTPAEAQFVYRFFDNWRTTHDTQSTIRSAA